MYYCSQLFETPTIFSLHTKLSQKCPSLNPPLKYTKNLHCNSDPGGFAGSSFLLNNTRRNEGDVSFFGKEENLEMKTPVAWHKSRNNRRTRKRKTLSHEAKFLDIKTPAAWPKRQETSDWVKSIPTKFFSPC